MGSVISLHSTSTTDTPPPQISWSADTNRHIPAEIVEEILLNLPVKSLLRFSAASKSWDSIIHEASFVKKYRGGKERIISNKYFFDKVSSCPLSAVLSNSNDQIEFETAIKEATSNYVYPFYPPQSYAFMRIIDTCNGFWFVENEENKSMFVWNPTIGTYRKLTWQIGCCHYSLHYGVGYDSAADDYKMLKICDFEVILYSLRCDSWRKLKPFPFIIRDMCISKPSCCVRGKLHWPYRTDQPMSNSYAIVSFDLSTEEYGKFALPSEYHPPRDEFNTLSLRGKLCLSFDCRRRFVLWVMEEYGVVESWTKKLDIDYHSISGFRNIHTLRPLSMFKDGKIVICLTRYKGASGVILVDENGETTLVRENIDKKVVYGSGFVYVESLVSPAMYVARPAS